MDPRRRPFTWLLVGVGALVCILRGGLLRVLDQLPACEVRHWTGLHCPGCGGTRCARRLMNGDLVGALAMNPAVTLIAAVAMVALLRGLWNEWRGGSGCRILAPWAVWAVAVFVTLFALTRNLPWWPFTLLAPP